jgi:predicted ArsR family transcriptional regulator
MPPAELIERRILATLATRGVLPISALRAAHGGCLDDRAARELLERLVAEGLVVRRAHRGGLWYIGYALAKPASEPRPSAESIPAPFRGLFAALCAS